MIQRISKPWGEEILFAHTSRYAGKILRIRAGESLSLQYHKRKDESLYVHTGTIRLTIEIDGREDVKTMGPEQAYHLPAGTRHSIEAIDDAVLFEVSTPELDDVVRLRDRYGRV
jgi:mannose-6-phosphate isomerase-like protein (cupin superfamily)